MSYWEEKQQQYKEENKQDLDIQTEGTEHEITSASVPN